MPQAEARTHTFQGTLDDNGQATDTTDADALVFAPCGEQSNFNINTELLTEVGISDPATTSYMTLDSTDDSVYHFTWKECAAP